MARRKGISTGTTAQRTIEEQGHMRFNTTTDLLEYYDGTAWKAIDAPPVVSSISPSSIDISNVANAPTITISGSGFSSSLNSIKFVGNDNTEYTGTSVNRVSESQATVSAPTGLTADNEPYDVQVTNSSGLAGTLADALSINDAPVFSIAAGTLGTLNDGDRSASALTNTTITATDEEGDTITFSLESGSLPSGLTLGSNGTISGTADRVSTTTTSTFTVRASDPSSNTTDRQYSITVNQPEYLVATGGTVSTDGDYKVHTFTSSSNFVVSHLGTNSTYGNKVEYLVVGGGGGGGFQGHGGAGGAGGYRHNSAYNFTVSVQSYAITVGSYGGAKTGGGNSTFANITSAGGGSGGFNNSENGRSGGSGGGGSGHFNNGSGGSGNTPSVSPSQGNNGGSGQDGTPAYGAGGGGGAGQAGQNGSNNRGGDGGNGSSNDIHGSSRTYSAGGGGHGHGQNNAGGNNLGGYSNAATGGRNTSNNYGMGGGGDNDNASSGVVILRYKFQ